MPTFAPAFAEKVPWMSGLVNGLQNRLRRFESARHLAKRKLKEMISLSFFYYSFVSFLSSTLFTRCIRLPRFSMSSRTLFILLKKSLKALSRKLG